jgi:hypothetical protein
MKQKRLFVLMSIFLLVALAGLLAFQQPALAAEKIVQFNNPGCQ